MQCGVGIVCFSMPARHQYMDFIEIKTKKFLKCLCVSKKSITFAPAFEKEQTFRCIRGVAQLVAFLVWDQAVAGSSPVTPTRKRSNPMQGGSFF